MRIALVQFGSGTDPAENLDAIRELSVQAARAGAELVVFPEASMCSFARPRADVAQPLSGPWAAAVRALAAELGIVIVVGMFTPGRSPDGKVRNTLLVTGPGIETHYDKIHLFDAFGYAESAQIEAGNELILFPFGGATIGVATCYDVRFPALFTELARAGADVILLPASWAPGPRKVEQWRSLVVARALDSTAWIVAVDQPEAAPGAVEQGKPKPTGVGHSMVVDPLGQVLVELGSEDELVVLEVDPARVAEARRILPVLENTRFVSSLQPPR